MTDQKYLVNIVVDETTKNPALGLFTYLEDIAVFAVTGVSNVFIFDNRPDVILNPDSRDVFTDLALLSWVKSGGYTMIVLDPAPKGTKKSEAVHKLWIAKDYKGHVGTHKFLVFEGETHKRDAISFVSLFRFR